MSDGEIIRFPLERCRRIESPLERWHRHMLEYEAEVERVSPSASATPLTDEWYQLCLEQEAESLERHHPEQPALQPDHLEKQR